MKGASVLGVVVLLAVWAPDAAGRAAADAIEVTIVDTFKFEVRITGLVLKLKAQPGTGAKAVSQAYLPLTSGGKEMRVWLPQIKTAQFAPQAAGGTRVKAVLQGQGDQVDGVFENPQRYVFEGRVARGPRAGRPVRVPLAEVKSLVNHTPYEGVMVPGKAGMVAMPAPHEDKLWVSSVPLGAEVYAKAFDCKEALVWPKYQNIGRTPLIRDLAPGKYAVKVMVPAKLAATLQPSTKLGADTNPFEYDGVGEVLSRENENVVASHTYTVVKKAGEAATVIALFQKKGLNIDEALKAFPEGHNFHFSDKKLEGRLLYYQVPKTDIPKILEALHRGGKVVWHGQTKSFIIELLPRHPWFKFSGAMRPKKNRRAP